MLKASLSHQQLSSLGGAMRNHGTQPVPGHLPFTPRNVAMENAATIYTQPQPGAKRWAYPPSHFTPKRAFADGASISSQPGKRPVTSVASTKNAPALQQRAAQQPPANPLASASNFPKTQSATQLNLLSERHPKLPPNTTPSQTRVPAATTKEGTPPHFQSPTKRLFPAHEHTSSHESDRRSASAPDADLLSNNESESVRLDASNDGSDEASRPPSHRPLSVQPVYIRSDPLKNPPSKRDADSKEGSIGQSLGSPGSPGDRSLREESPKAEVQPAQQVSADARTPANLPAPTDKNPNINNVGSNAEPQAHAPKVTANQLRLKPPQLAVKYAEAMGIPRASLDAHFQKDHLIFPEGGPVHSAQQALAKAFKHQIDNGKKNVGTTWADVQTSVWESVGMEAFYTKYAEFFGLKPDMGKPENPLGHDVGPDGLKSAAVPRIMLHLNDRYKPEGLKPDGTEKTPMDVVDDHARLARMLTEMDMFVADSNKWLGRTFSGRTETESVRDHVFQLIGTYEKFESAAMGQANKEALGAARKGCADQFAKTGLSVNDFSMANLLVPNPKPPAGITAPSGLPTKPAANLGLYTAASAISAVNFSNPVIDDDKWMDLLPMVATGLTSFVVFDSLIDLARQVSKAKDATAEAKQQAAAIEKADQQLNQHEANLERWMKKDPRETLAELKAQWSALVEENSTREGWPGPQQDAARAEFAKREAEVSLDLESLQAVLGKDVTWEQPSSAHPNPLKDLLAPKLEATKMFRAQFETSLALSALDATTRMSEAQATTQSGLKRLAQLGITVVRSLLLTAGRLAEFFGPKLPFGANTLTTAIVAMIESKIRFDGRIGESAFKLTSDQLTVTHDRMFTRHPGTGKVLEHALSALAINKDILNQGYTVLACTKVLQGFASLGAFAALPVLGPLAPLITGLVSSFAGTVAATAVNYVNRENKNTTHMQKLVEGFDQSIQNFANEETLKRVGLASQEKMEDLEVFLEEYIKNARATQETMQGKNEDGPRSTENARRSWDYIKAMNTTFRQLGAPKELSADFFQAALRCKPLPADRAAPQDDPLRDQLRKTAKMLLLETNLYTGTHSQELETKAGLGRTPLRDKRLLRPNALMQEQFRRPQYA